ncbi:MAG: S1 RNA-binding domain-containing protein, partial [Anaerolineae bacterium]
TSITNFGAFVDLGGADGLIHVSELSWGRVDNPRQVLKVGDELDVYVLDVDLERKRIALSLKKLQPDPWTIVDDHYQAGQLVEGRVTRVLDFGAFIELDLGIEGLLHASEMIGTPELAPSDVIRPGEKLLVKVIRIDSRRKRLALSARQVRKDEWEHWVAEQQAGSKSQEDKVAVSETIEEDAAVPEAEAEISTVAEAEIETPKAAAAVSEAVEEESVAPEAAAQVSAVTEAEIEEGAIAPEAEAEISTVAEAEVEAPEATVAVSEAVEEEAPEAEISAIAEAEIKAPESAVAVSEAIEEENLTPGAVADESADTPALDVTPEETEVVH